MTPESGSVSATQCRKWRIAYQDGMSPYQLAVEHDTPRQIVLTHLVGDCSHDIDVRSISKGRTHNVSIAECTTLRKRYASGESTDELQSMTGRRWSTLVRHLTGNCSHDSEVDAPTVTKGEILEVDRVSAEQCASFRREVHEEGNVMAVAESTDVDYQVLLAHVNGECNHDVDEPPREPNDRSQDISRDECREIRERYRSSPNVEVADIAPDYDCSSTTIERHVRFQCSHPPVDSLVTEVEAVQDILTQELGEDDRSQLTSNEIVQLNNTDNADRQEPARDLGEPDPDRIETTRSRIIRNTDLAHDVKAMYGYECQVCGKVRRGPDGEPYAEAHHIRPLGAPHEGPDEPENILVLCPNHHSDFDFGRLTVDPQTYEVSHTYEEAADGTRLDVADPHEPAEDHLTYHNQVIAGK